MARKGNTTVTLDIRYILEDVAKQANKELAKELRLWARTAKRNVTRASGLKQLNQKVADKARERVKMCIRDRNGPRPPPPRSCRANTGCRRRQPNRRRGCLLYTSKYLLLRVS